MFPPSTLNHTCSLPPLNRTCSLPPLNHTCSLPPLNLLSKQRWISPNDSQIKTKGHLAGGLDCYNTVTFERALAKHFASFRRLGSVRGNTRVMYVGVKTARGVAEVATEVATDVNTIEIEEGAGTTAATTEATTHPKGSLDLFPPDRDDPRPGDLMSRLASLRQVVTLAEYTDLLGEVFSGGIARSAAGGKETKEHGTDGASSSSRAGLEEEGPPPTAPSSSRRRFAGAYAGNEGGSATISSAGNGDTLDTPTTIEHVVVLPLTSWSTRDRLPALWNMSLREFPKHNIAWARAYEPARNGHEANPLMWHGRRPDGGDGGDGVDGRAGTAWDRAQSLWMDTIHNCIHKYLRRTTPEDVRWFLVTDDDMWINVPSLLRFVNRPRAGGGHGDSVGINSRVASDDEPRRPLEHNLPVAFGHGWPWYRWDETSDFISGGVLLSREAMVRISQHLYTGVCPRPPSWNPRRRSMSEEGEDGRDLVEEKTKPCDVFLSECLLKVGVALIASPFHHAIPPHLKGYPGGERTVIQEAYLKKEQSRDEAPNELRNRVAAISPFDYESAIVVNGFVGNKALEILAKRVQLRRRLLQQALSSVERGGLLDTEGDVPRLSRWWYGGAAPP